MLKWPERYRNGITLTSRERHVVSCHRPFDCLIISLCGPTSKKHQSPHYWPFVRGMNSPVTGEVLIKGSAAVNAEKASIWRRHRCVIWIRNKMGNTYNYLRLHSYHSIKYIISIRELLNHNCCVKRSSQIRTSHAGLTPKPSASQTPHQPGSKDIWWLPGLFLFPLCHLKMQL